MLVTKQLLVAIDFHSMEKNGYQQKIIPKCKYHALSFYMHEGTMCHIISQFP